MKLPYLRRNDAGLVILIQVIAKLPLLLTPLTYIHVGNKEDGSFMARPAGAKLETLHCVVSLEKG